jgi:tetratricopeptide (TPR) repeat protein/transglutaminase-like putative cysteine protease
VVAWALLETVVSIPPARAVEVAVGPRAIAMGGAFSSIASDATALFWNPAGLVRLDNQELTFSYADLYGTGIQDLYSVYALPFSRKSVTAFDVYHSGFNDGELDFGETRFDIGTAYGSEKISGGLTGKYVRRQTGLDGSSVRDGGGFGLDLGILGRPVRGLSIALVGQDLFGTKINYPKNGTSTEIEQTLRASVSYAYKSLGLVALDLDDQYHAGIELTPTRMIALRAGLRKDREGDADLITAYGAGFKVGVFQANYAYESHPVLGGTSHFGLSLEYSLNPPQVRIEKVDVPAIYSSLYSSYAVTPFGSASITNLKDEALPIRVRVRLEGLMDGYAEIDTLLRPKQTQEIPLTAVLSDDMLGRTGDGRADVDVEAVYQSLRVTRTDRSRGRCDVFAPGAINWSRGVDQAAAYVTSGDPVVLDFANQAIRAGSGVGGDLLTAEKFASAASAVDALATLDMTYVEDPERGYSKISKQDAIDTVRYPRETLRRLSGDCDDTTVLLAALLGSTGVKTQFVDAPGHLFLLFDTGVHQNNLGALGVPEDLLVVADESVWVPLETTALRRGFAQSWRLGAMEYRNYEAHGEVHRVDVLEAQSKYTPITAPRSPGAVPPINGDAVRNRLRADEAMIDSIKADLRRQTSGVKPDVAMLQQAAHERFRAGEPEEASILLLQVLRVYGQSAAVRNNLGCVYLAMGQPAKAVEQFQQALALEPNDAGIVLNLGMALQAKGDKDQALRKVREGIQKAGGYEKARALMGILPGTKVSANLSDPDRAARQLMQDSMTGKAGTTSKGAAAPGTSQALYWREGR